VSYRNVTQQEFVPLWAIGNRQLAIGNPTAISNQQLTSMIHTPNFSPGAATTILPDTILSMH
jgi:hypothetical protein